MSTDDKKRIKAHDFKYIGTDSIGFAWSDNNSKIIFGIEDVDGSTLEQMGVIMSHKAAKTLSILLAASIEVEESRTGTKILSDLNLEEVKESMTKTLSKKPN